MQVLALLLLLMATASMVFAFDVPAVAQEASSDEEMTEEDTMEETEEELSDEEMTEEDTMEEIEEELSDEEMTEEDTMEETEEELVDSPLKQMLTGTEPHEIKCKTGQKLVFKASNWRPACINESSFDVLAARGWVATHDPSHEDLMKMQDEYKAKHLEEAEEETEEEMEEEVEAETELNEEEVMEDEAVEDGTETEDEETQPQDYSVELKESVNVSAL